MQQKRYFAYQKAQIRVQKQQDVTCEEYAKSIQSTIQAFFFRALELFGFGGESSLPSEPFRSLLLLFFLEVPP